MGDHPVMQGYRERRSVDKRSALARRRWELPSALTTDRVRGNLVMRGAGIVSIGGPVSDIELPDPRPLADDEVLIAVRAAGVANWDEIVSQGGWDVGIAPPMALGVEAAGVVTEVGAAVH